MEYLAEKILLGLGCELVDARRLASHPSSRKLKRTKASFRERMGYLAYMIKYRKAE